jgi:hypothetical protein
MEEQIKQEAKERVKEHLKLMQKNYAREDYSKILATMVFNDEATGHAIKTIQKEIDLLEELAYSENRIRNVSAFKILNTKLNNLKKVKTEIESI